MHGTDVGAASTLGLRFEIDRLESGNYRIAAWQVVWDALAPVTLAPARLYEGETAGTLATWENVFCIAVSAAPGALDELRRALEASPAFHRVAGNPAFLDTVEVVAEPLAEAGCVSAEKHHDPVPIGLQAAQRGRESWETRRPPNSHRRWAETPNCNLGNP